MRNISDQRFWFNDSQRFWNSEKNPKFAETLTQHGIGFSFNLIEDFKLLQQNRTSHDFRYSYGDENLRLTRPFSTGAQIGSEYTISFPKFDLLGTFIRLCREQSFALHSPYELPAASKMVSFDYGMELDVWIEPVIIETEESLRSFSPDHRNCYFENERKLNYFKIYTQNNCEIECLSFIGEF